MLFDCVIEISNYSFTKNINRRAQKYDSEFQIKPPNCGVFLPNYVYFQSFHEILKYVGTYKKVVTQSMIDCPCLKVSKFRKQIFLFSFEQKNRTKLFYDFWPKDLKSKIPYFREQFPRKLFFFESFSAESIQGRKVFKGGNYCFFSLFVCIRKFPALNNGRKYCNNWGCSRQKSICLI